MDPGIRHRWTGGDCPVEWNRLVVVTLRDGTTVVGNGRMHNWKWNATDPRRDIVSWALPLDED